MKLNLGCGPHYADGWVNVDRITTEYINSDGDPEVIRPDVEANVLEGLPFESGVADEIYLGHVLEHIPWSQVPDVLFEVRRVLAPGGQLCVVGPDLHLTIKGWREGKWHDIDGDGGYWLVESVMEHSAMFMAGGEAWEGARHQWNCFEKRASDVVEHAGFSRQWSYTGRLADLRVDGWPLVADTEWQFGFVAQV